MYWRGHVSLLYPLGRCANPRVVGTCRILGTQALVSGTRGIPVVMLSYSGMAGFFGFLRSTLVFLGCAAGLQSRPILLHQGALLGLPGLRLGPRFFQPHLRPLCVQWRRWLRVLVLMTRLSGARVVRRRRRRVLTRTGTGSTVCVGTRMMRGVTIACGGGCGIAQRTDSLLVGMRVDMLSVLTLQGIMLRMLTVTG